MRAIWTVLAALGAAACSAGAAPTPQSGVDAGPVVAPVAAAMQAPEQASAADARLAEILAAGRAFEPGYGVVGLSHGDENNVADDEIYLALYEDAAGAELIWGRTKVDIVFDEVLDGEVPTAEDVSFTPLGEPRTESPQILLRGPNLAARAAPRAVFGAPRQRGAAFETDLTLNGAPAGTLIWTAELADGRCSLTFERNGRFAMLASSSGSDGSAKTVEMVCGEGESWGGPESRNPAPAPFAALVVFAGDLDGDGHVDMLLSPDVHYNVSNTALFLSTEARAGAPLDLFAKTWRTGC